MPEAQMTALSFVIAGGGTGGHVTPALALAEAIARRDANDRVLFIGSDRGLEVDLVPRAGFELVSLSSRPVMGRGLAGRVLGGAAIARATLRARREIIRVRADVVISVGGYAAMPAVLATRLARTRLALVEPNAVPGRANCMASRIAGRVFVGFPEAAGRMGLARGDVRLREYGIPLRRALVDAFGGETARRRPEPPYRLLVFGGSQGARQINEAVIDALTSGADLPLEVFHQTGSADRERVVAAYAKSGVKAEVTAFEPDMPSRYRWADLAVCRAGALTVAELALAGLPALLVPYPYAADDHQSANARALEAVGAAQRLDPQDVDGALIESRLRELFSAPERLV
jgi:UDP-N-acetylglucosamine--N-acetylmuramyl-(pentapeptide) pyrophosphoryl-undecaprenol N-acetylglucosamine transferase